MIAIDLNKQQTLDTDPKSIQQLNFISRLKEYNRNTMFLIIEKMK